MRIALFTDGITPFVMGGIQRHSFYLCKYLARNGVDIDLYHTVPYFAQGDDRSESRFSNVQPELQQRSIDSSEKTSGITSSKVAPDLTKVFTPEELEHITPYFIQFPERKIFPGHYVRESYEYSKNVYSAFLKNSSNVDFVYSKNYTSWKYLEEKQKGRQLPPIGVKLHGYELYQTQTNARDWLGSFFHKEPTLFNSRMADIVFSYGGKITEILERKVGVHPEKICEIPTGISEDWLLNVEKHTRQNGKTNFIFIGRYTRRKGIHLIEEVIERIDPEKCTFTFVGPMPEEKRLSLPNVRYTGPLSDETEIRRELQNADVLLCPSSSEGMPNVILEGMASGCAVIATNVGAVDDMVSPKNGWIIESSSSIKLMQSIESCLLTSKNELNSLQMNSLKKTRDKFLWPEVVQVVIEKINATVKGINDLKR